MPEVLSRHGGAGERADVGAFVPGPRIRRAAQGAGALDGLTFAVKDLIDVASVPTGGGNPDWLAGQQPAAVSAPVVDALLDAGATLVGKTITDELAFSLEGVNAHYGTPVNPACPDCIPGGSSSGSAVAVAVGLVDFALGTDTGGSVRVPASFTGIYGFRPTHDALSLRGVMPFAPSYDTVGWFGRDAAMLCRVGEVLLPQREAPPIRRLRMVRDAFDLVDPAVAKVLIDAAAKFGAADDISLFEGGPDLWRECYHVMQGADIRTQLGPWITAHNPRFGEAIAPRFADALAITDADAARWHPVRKRLAKRVYDATSDGTALILPAAPCGALSKAASGDEIGRFYQRALALTSPAGHAGAPQIVIPAGRVDGRPVGLSILAAGGSDRELLRLADAQARSRNGNDNGL